MPTFINLTFPWGPLFHLSGCRKCIIEINQEDMCRSLSANLVYLVITNGAVEVCIY